MMIEALTKRRILEGLYAVSAREPATLVRGSSRRITIMRLRPANIRVINRRANASVVIGAAVTEVW
jgi:hypothetical protein